MDAYTARKTSLDKDLLFVIATVSTYMAAKLNCQAFEQVTSFLEFEESCQYTEFSRSESTYRVKKEMYHTLENDIMRRLGHRMLAVTPLEIAKSIEYLI